jgi:diguanylate cyclase (GGDEF)-like protein
MTSFATTDSYSGDSGQAPPVWVRPDPALAAAGIEGEMVVARVRVLAMALLLIAPTWNILTNPKDPIHVTGFSVTLAAAIASLAIWWLLRRGRWRPWVGFASSAFDVSMISLALISFLIVGSPLIALNSKVTFEMYFLAVVATSLRYDARICIVVGLLALCEYGGLWIYAATHFNLTNPAYIPDAGPYSAVDLSTRLILLGIATLLAITIVRRAQRLLYLASRDRLTGLFNRGHFDRALGMAMESTARDGQPLALALLDIDHFKQINDAYGHALGDRALLQVANFLARAMRRTDMVARYGGEEFVILMPGTERHAAVARMELLRQEVADTPIDLGDGQTLRLNFSAGIAGTPSDQTATTPKELMTIADRRLLAAKRAGRGRCIGSDAIVVEPAQR